MNHVAPALGIDFGTTNSSMAWFDPHTREARVFRNAEGEVTTPSVVYCSAQEVIVGKDADHELTDNGDNPGVSQRIITSIKRRLLALPVIALPGGQTTRPAEVVAAVLAKLKRDAEEGHFREAVRQATLTCPATFNTVQRDVLREAAQLAGFAPELVTLVDEPVAAAVAFAQLGQKVGQGVLVYDLGGGTFDVAVVVREPDGTFRVALEPDGDPECGGDDFDRALYDYWDADIQVNMGRTIALRPGERALRFLQQCKHWKENLGRRAGARFGALLPGEGAPYFQTTLDRAAFEAFIEETVERTVRKTQAMFNRAQEAGYPVDTVVLIGGASRLPLLQERLKAALPVEPRQFPDADLAVALGAAYYPHIRPPATPAATVDMGASSARSSLQPWYRLAPGWREFLAARCSQTAVWLPTIQQPLAGINGAELLRAGLARSAVPYCGDYLVELDMNALLAAGRFEEIRRWLEADDAVGHGVDEPRYWRYLRTFFLDGDHNRARVDLRRHHKMWSSDVGPVLLLIQGYKAFDVAQQYLTTAAWGGSLLADCAKIWQWFFDSETVARACLRLLEDKKSHLVEDWLQCAEAWGTVYDNDSGTQRCLGRAEAEAASDSAMLRRVEVWQMCAEGWKVLADNDDEARRCMGKAFEETLHKSQYVHVAAAAAQDWVGYAKYWRMFYNDEHRTHDCL